MHKPWCDDLQSAHQKHFKEEVHVDIAWPEWKSFKVDL
jgi:hypothetical protein